MGFYAELWGFMGNYGEAWGCMGKFGVLWGIIGMGVLLRIMGNYGDILGCVCKTSREDIHSHSLMPNSHGWRNNTVHAET